MLEVRFQSELFSDAQATRPLRLLLDLRISPDSCSPNPASFTSMDADAATFLPSDMGASLY